MRRSRASAESARTRTPGGPRSSQRVARTLAGPGSSQEVAGACSGSGSASQRASQRFRHAWKRRWKRFPARFTAPHARFPASLHACGRAFTGALGAAAHAQARGCAARGAGPRGRAGLGVRAARGARPRARARPRGEDPGLASGPEQVDKRLRPEQVVKLLQGGGRGFPICGKPLPPGGKELGSERSRAGPGASALRIRDPCSPKKH